MHKLQDGKTAQQLISEKITVIDGSVKGIVASFYSNDMNALHTNARFLRDRPGSYQNHELTLR